MLYGLCVQSMLCATRLLLGQDRWESFALVCTCLDSNFLQSGNNPFPSRDAAARENYTGTGVRQRACCLHTDAGVAA